MSDDEDDTWYDAPSSRDHQLFFGGLPDEFKRRVKPQPKPKPTERGLEMTIEQYKDLNKNEDLYRGSHIQMNELCKSVKKLQAGISATPEEYEILRYKFNKINPVVPEVTAAEKVNINTISILDQMIWIAHLFLLRGYNWMDIILTLCIANQSQLLLGASVTFLKNTFENPKINLNADFTAAEIFAMELEFHKKFKTNGLFFVYDMTKLDGSKGGKRQRALVVCNAAYRIRWSETIDADDNEEDYVVFQRTEFFKHLIDKVLPMKLKLICRNCEKEHLIDMFGFGDTKSDPKGELYKLTDGLLYKPFFAEKVNMEHRVVSDEFVFNRFFEAIRWPVERIFSPLKKCGYTRAHFTQDQFSNEFHKLVWTTICLRHNAIKSGFFLSKNILEKDESPWPTNENGRQTMNINIQQLRYFRCTFDFEPIRRIVYTRYAPGDLKMIVELPKTVPVANYKRPVSPPGFYTTSAVKKASLDFMDNLYPCSEDEEY